MALRDDKSVAGGDGVVVVDGDGVSVGQDNFGVVWFAEGAGGLIGHVICSQGIQMSESQTRPQRVRSRNLMPNYIRAFFRRARASGCDHSSK